jgi:hypothetical protein
VREREETRGGTGFRCIMAHEGERSGTQGGASVHAVRRRMRYAKQADTCARAPRPSGRRAWVHGSDAKRSALELVAKDGRWRRMDPNSVRPWWKMPLSGGSGLAERKTKKRER